MQDWPLSFNQSLMALVSLVFTSATLAASNALVLNSHELKPLRTIVSDSGHDSSRPQIIMLYQPDCPWCKKQSKVLSKLVAECSDSLDISLLGHNGTRHTLKRELKHYPKNLSAYLSDTAFLRSIGGAKASPTTLFYDEVGHLIAKQRGQIPEEKLIGAAEVLTNAKCKI